MDKPIKDPRDVKDDLRDKGYSKAARFLMLLGKEEAARVMKHLDEEEVAGITMEISQVDKIEATEATSILEEFGYLIKTGSSGQGWSGHGRGHTSKSFR